MNNNAQNLQFIVKNRQGEPETIEIGKNPLKPAEMQQLMSFVRRQGCKLEVQLNSCRALLEYAVDTAGGTAYGVCVNCYQKSTMLIIPYPFDLDSEFAFTCPHCGAVHTVTTEQN